MTFVVAVHDISDPDRFWGAADPSAEFPPGVRLHSTYPRQDGARAVCLWEADSVESVRTLVDSFVGDSSTNEYFEVDPQHAGTRGLPTATAAGR